LACVESLEVSHIIPLLETFRRAVSYWARLAAVTLVGAMPANVKSPSSPAGPVTGRQPPLYTTLAPLEQFGSTVAAPMITTLPDLAASGWTVAIALSGVEQHAWPVAVVETHALIESCPAPPEPV